MEDVVGTKGAGMLSGLRLRLVAAAACGVVIVVGGLSASPAGADFSNYCQPGWQPGAACQLAAPTPENPSHGQIRFSKTVGNVTLAPGEQVVISFTNSGCPVSSTPIDVWAVLGLDAKGQQPSTQVGTIAATAPSKTNRISFAVPRGPDPPFGVAHFSMSFSAPAMKSCYPPGYSGTWILGAGETNGCAPRTVGSLGYKTGETVIRYTVSRISRKCGPVRLSAAGKHLATLPTSPSRQSGHAVIRGRRCKVNLHVLVKPGASNTVLGKGSDGDVIYARGDVKGPDGETLRTGDLLCSGEKGASPKFPDLTVAGDAPLTQTPRYLGYFDGSNTGATLERNLKLRVGSTGALWFGIGTFGSEVAHLNCTGPTTSCNVGAGKPITGGAIDVPAAHIRVGGAVTARRLVLGLGHGRTVTLRPPETAPAAYFPPGHIPLDDEPNLQVIRATPCCHTFGIKGNGLPITGFGIFVPTRQVVEGLVQMARAGLGAAGRVDFRGGITGFGSVLARGDITVRGRLTLGTDALSALSSLGNISQLGTT